MSNTKDQQMSQDIIAHSDTLSDQISTITNEIQNALCIPDDKLAKIDYIEYNIVFEPRINVKMHLK